MFYDKSGVRRYAIEGSVFVGGALIQWLRDGLQIISSSSEIETLARSVDDNGGVYIVPALAGLGAPFWREDIRGTIFGLSRGTKRGHIARAALEAMAYRVRDIFEALKPGAQKAFKQTNELDLLQNCQEQGLRVRGSGVASSVNEHSEDERNAVIGDLATSQINVDGGASANDLLMQFQADLLQTPVQRYSEKEMTALGAAIIAGIGEKINLRKDTCFQPRVNLDAHYSEWRGHLGKLLSL